MAGIKKYVCVHYRVCAFEYGIFYSPGSTVEQRFTGKQGLSRNLLPADYLYRSCNGTNGYFNVLLNRIGVEGTNWLGNTSTAMGSIIFMEMFNIGTAMTIVLAGLQDVPRDFYEAANLDGATAVQKFFKITFPMISPVVFFNVLMAIIKGLQIFTQPYVMTQGGPAQSTYVYGLYLYNTAFSYGKFGYASSLAWVLFVIIIIITMVIMKTSNAWVFYREDVK